MNEYFISPKVFLYPFGINIGSYPKPFSPFGGNCNVPKTFPSNDFIVPSGNAMDSAQQRKAFLCCALSIALPDGTIKSFEGKVFGTLQFPPKGENGFGYDPIFIPKGYKKTFGEMKYSFKERIS